MAGTFLCPNTCGFGKVAAYELARNVEGSLVRQEREGTAKYRGHLKQEQYRLFKEHFHDVVENFNLDFTTFQKKLPSLKETIKKWNFRKMDEKNQYLKAFSVSSWNKLSSTQKKEHSFKNCKGCRVRFAVMQTYFPLKSNVLKGKAKSNPVFGADQISKQMRGETPSVKPLKKEIKSAATVIYNKLSPVFDKNFSTSLATALTMIPELHLQQQSKNDRRNERRNHYNRAKENMERQMSETAFLRYVNVYNIKSTITVFLSLK